MKKRIQLGVIAVLSGERVTGTPTEINEIGSLVILTTGFVRDWESIEAGTNILMWDHIPSKDPEAKLLIAKKWLSTGRIIEAKDLDMLHSWHESGISTIPSSSYYIDGSKVFPFQKDAYFVKKSEELDLDEIPDWVIDTIIVPDRIR